MNGMKNAALVLQHQDGREHTRLDGIDKLSAFEYITRSTEAQGSAASFLGYGHRNALTTREISRNSGLNSRDVTRTICSARKQGAPPILSDLGVEFWLADQEEENNG